MRLNGFSSLRPLGERRLPPRREAYALVLAGVVLFSFLIVRAGPAHAIEGTGIAPLDGPLIRGFDPPEHSYGTGHRGVDMGGEPGQIVVAPLDGIVSFAGQVAGRGVLTLGHGEHSTTYEPVTPLVSAGDSVIEGEAIAILDEGHACSAEACLHWGLRLGETYLNPLSLIDPSGIPRHIRLLPDEEVDELRTRRAEGAAGPRLVSAAGFVSPAAGVVSSDYGWRIHPVYGDERFHDGLDIAAPCGAPLAAAVGGVVTEVFYHSGYGHRLLIDHGLIDGVHVTTAYNHAEGYEVSVGEIVSTGQVIGAVGTTGTSTGCHLHFQVWTDDVLVDPAGFLP